MEAKNTTGVRITDLERTVIDSIRDFNKIGGFEELLNCLESVHYLDETKLKRYLDIYNTQGLYQKARVSFGSLSKRDATLKGVCRVLQEQNRKKQTVPCK